MKTNKTEDVYITPEQFEELNKIREAGLKWNENQRSKNLLKEVAIEYDFKCY